MSSRFSEAQDPVDPDGPLPERFVDAYAELQDISNRLRVSDDEIPDIDAIGPMVKRAQRLANMLEGRIAEIRKALSATQQTG
jgi:hypothetical protein